MIYIGVNCGLPVVYHRKPKSKPSLKFLICSILYFSHLCGPNADNMGSFWILAGVGATAFALVSFLAYRYLRKGGGT